MPLVRIDTWPLDGRQKKQLLIRKVTDAVVEGVGCPPDAVQVMLNEVDKDDWATGGVCHTDLFPQRG